jgi:DegV family protein with EDD domain
MPVVETGVGLIDRALPHLQPSPSGHHRPAVTRITPVTVHVVTDSASDLPLDVAASAGIEVVPLSVRFGAEELVDGVELTPNDFWTRLATTEELPETAAPAAGAFAQRFRELFARGASGIVCINLSSELSATMQAAVVAASEVADVGPVRVVDSRSASIGLGSLCLSAAELAATGATLDDVVADVEDRRDCTQLYATLDTLEFLRRGGRIGGAKAFLGSVLSIKPVVEVRDGKVEPAGQVRTRSKALRLLADKVAAQPVERVAVLHGNAVDVEVFLDLLAASVPRHAVTTGLVGPVIGTHAGPGVIGVTYQVPRP